MNNQQFRIGILNILTGDESATVHELRLAMADDWKADGHWPLHADVFGMIFGERAWLWTGGVPSTSYFTEALRDFERAGFVQQREERWILTPHGLSFQQAIREMEADESGEPVSVAD